MKQIEPTQVEFSELKKTHQIFFEESVIRQSQKALHVRIMNSKGAWTRVWIPKSRLLFQEITILQTHVIDKDGNFQPNPEYMQTKKRYFVPKFFTR